MPPAILTQGLTKIYGRRLGIQGLDLEVHPGEIFGFIGPNGAGKTTTIRLLLDLLHPTSGRAQVLGLDSHRQSVEVRRSVGTCRESSALTSAPRDGNWCDFARLRGMADLGSADSLAERLGVDLDLPTGRLSRGNRQKVGLVQALFHQPALAILDEPTTGLDPLVQDTFLQLLREARTEGRTIFLSSHILSEVERLCDRVAIVRNGRLAALETTESLLEKRRKRVTLVFAGPVDAAVRRSPGRERRPVAGRHAFAEVGGRHRRGDQTGRPPHPSGPQRRTPQLGRSLPRLLRREWLPRGSPGAPGTPTAPSGGAAVNAHWWLLTKQQLRPRVRSIVIWGVVLGALGALYVALFPSMSDFLRQYLDQASEQMQQFMGQLRDSMTIEGWMEMEFFNSIVPLALPFLVIPFGARAISGNEERKTLDLLLSNPLPRRHVVASALASMAAIAGMRPGHHLDPHLHRRPRGRRSLGPGVWRPASSVLWVFCLLFGTLALLVSAWVRRSFLAIVIPTALLVAMYVIGNLAQVSKKAEPIRVFSLFYHLGHPLRGDFPWTAVLLMLAAICVIAAAAPLVRPPRHRHLDSVPARAPGDPRRTRGGLCLGGTAFAAARRRGPLGGGCCGFLRTDVVEVDVHAHEEQHHADDDQNDPEERQYGGQPEGQGGQVHLPLEVHAGHVGELRRVGGVEFLATEQVGVAGSDFWRCAASVSAAKRASEALVIVPAGAFSSKTRSETFWSFSWSDTDSELVDPSPMDTAPHAMTTTASTMIPIVSTVLMKLIPFPRPPTPHKHVETTLPVGAAARPRPAPLLLLSTRHAASPVDPEACND